MLRRTDAFHDVWNTNIRLEKICRCVQVLKGYKLYDVEGLDKKMETALKDAHYYNNVELGHHLP